jgi:hypothetical protein
MLKFRGRFDMRSPIKRPPHPGQLEMSFFSIPEIPRSEAGALDISMAVRDALTEMLSAASVQGKDRHEVGAQVSRLSNRDMSKNMLDRYCAPSADEWRFPLEALPSLTLATGDYRLLELLAEKCGCRIARGEEALLAEIGALMLQEKSAKSRLGVLQKNLPDGMLERLIEKNAKRNGGAT